jgi:hypothetical protein
MRGLLTSAAAILGLAVVSSCEPDASQGPFLVLAFAAGEPPQEPDELGYLVAVQSSGGQCVALQVTGGELSVGQTRVETVTLHVEFAKSLVYLPIYTYGRAARVSAALHIAVSASDESQCSGPALMQRSLLVPPDQSGSSNDARSTDSASLGTSTTAGEGENEAADTTTREASGTDSSADDSTTGPVTESGTSSTRGPTGTE